jgi:phosphate transport system ATP-binding protein
VIGCSFAVATSLRIECAVEVFDRERQLRRFADYVILLYPGELIEHGPTESIFTEPNEPRTKAYIEGAFG